MDEKMSVREWLKPFYRDDWQASAADIMDSHARSLAQLAEKVALLQLELDDLKLRLGRQEQP